MDDIIEIRWTTSRALDTYGYNICSLWFNGKKKASCSGGGYDMEGTAFGDWVAQNFQDRLVKLTDMARFHYLRVGEGLERLADCANGELAMTIYWKDAEKTKIEHVSIDGGCGLEVVKRIMERIGIAIQFRGQHGDRKMYVVRGARER